jgi:hypothetical protein
MVEWTPPTVARTRAPVRHDERRYYLFGLGGDHIFFDDTYAGSVTTKAAGAPTGRWAAGAASTSTSTGRRARHADGQRPEHHERRTGQDRRDGHFHDLPTARYRWQFWRGRLVPYVTAGIGAAITTPNDPRTSSTSSRRDAADAEVRHPERVGAGTVGAGVEFFLNHHVSIGSVFRSSSTRLETSVQQRTPPARTSAAGEGQLELHGIFPNVRLTAYMP